MSVDEQRIQAANRELRRLGEQFAAARLDHEQYRQSRRQLIAEALGESPAAEATVRTPALEENEPEKFSRWFWLVPVILAVIGLGGVIGLALLLWRDV